MCVCVSKGIFSFLQSQKDQCLNYYMCQVNCKELELQCLNTDSKQGLQGYAMKFLKYNSTHAQYSAAQMPLTPDLISDVGIIDIAWEDNLTEV